MSRKYANNPLWKKNPEYMAHLTSEYWAGVRKLVWGRAGGRCEKCGRRSCKDLTLDVNHISYAHFGSERDHLDDLELLCRECHDARDCKQTPSWGELRELWSKL